MFVFNFVICSYFPQTLLIIVVPLLLRPDLNLRFCVKYLQSHPFLAKEKQMVTTGEHSLFKRYKEGFVLTERGLQEKVWFFLTNSGIVCMCVCGLVLLFYYNSWDSENGEPAILVWTHSFVGVKCWSP